jgi:hypothetical protein
VRRGSKYRTAGHDASSSHIRNTSSYLSSHGFAWNFRLLHCSWSSPSFADSLSLCERIIRTSQCRIHASIFATSSTAHHAYYLSSIPRSNRRTSKFNLVVCSRERQGLPQCPSKACNPALQLRPFWGHHCSSHIDTIPSAIHSQSRSALRSCKVR